MSSSWMGWALTIAALLMRMSIWKGLLAGCEKWVFAVEIRCSGAEGSRRSARMGTALMLCSVESLVARACARASDEAVA